MPLVIRDIVNAKIEEDKVALGDVACEGCHSTEIIMFD